MPLPRPRWRRARLRWRPWSITRSAMVACLLAVVTMLAACSAPGAAPHAAPSSDVRTYDDCLFSHTQDSGGTGPRKACQAQRPAGGLGLALETFASCLNRHGVVLASQSPGASVSDALRYLNQFRTGSTAQRAAFNACLSSVR